MGMGSGRLAWIAMLASGLALGAAPSALADWQVEKIPDGPVDSVLFGVSCPSKSLCVAVGSNSVVASSTNPAGGSAAWQVVHPEGQFESPGGGSVRYTGNQIRGVSCPSTALCVAAGPQGHMLVSTDPIGGAWRVLELGLAAAHLEGISCPTESLCVAVGYNGTVVTSTHPDGDASAWTVSKLSTSPDLRGVSCPATSLCVAVDNEGEILSSVAPTGGAAAWRSAGRPGGSGHLNGISCPTTGFCLTANAGQFIASTAPAAGAWSAFSAGTGLPVKGIACPALTACAAVDNNANAIVSTDPLGGAGAWQAENVIPPSQTPGGEPNGMFGISCPSRSLCVAVGQDRQVMVSTDPFAAAGATGNPAGGRPAGNGRHRPRGRPDVRITWHPLRRTKPRGRRTQVTFRFRAIGRARRFKCKLDRRRFRPCRSPRRYRLSRGKHVFRVFAIGPSGKRGRVTTFHFRIGHLTESPPVGSCEQNRSSGRFDPCVTPR